MKGICNALPFAIMLWAVIYLAACSSSNGGRFYCGFEETNGLQKIETYKTSEVKK